MKYVLIMTLFCVSFFFEVLRCAHQIAQEEAYALMEFVHAMGIGKVLIATRQSVQTDVGEEELVIDKLIAVCVIPDTLVNR